MRYTLRQLEIFRVVADMLSYTAAAERLHLTQPAVFAQVRALEAQTGAPLIARIGRRLELTDTGHAVLRTAIAIKAEAARLDQALAEIRGVISGRLDLAVVSTAKYVLPRLIGPFTRDHPGIDIRLTVGNRNLLLDRLSGGLDDLYILGAVPPDMDANHVVLSENPLVLIAPPDHPLAGQTDVPLSEVARYPLLLREEGSGTRRAVEAHFADHGLVAKARLELGANEAVKQAVMAGLGLAVLSRGAVQLEVDHGYLVEIATQGFPLARKWHLAWHRQKTLTQAAIELRDRMVQARPSGT
ncbi:MAG: LysR family transcriptional regulator [Hyphomonas sp.]